VHGLSFSSDSVLSWPISTPAEAVARAPSSPEIEVVELFEELRDRLLRYLLVLGLSAHDGEEIIQESFHRKTYPVFCYGLMRITLY